MGFIKWVRLAHGGVAGCLKAKQGTSRDTGNASHRTSGPGSGQPLNTAHRDLKSRLLDAFERWLERYCQAQEAKVRLRFGDTICRLERQRHHRQLSEKHSAQTAEPAESSSGAE